MQRRARAGTFLPGETPLIQRGEDKVAPSPRRFFRDSGGRASASPKAACSSASLTRPQNGPGSAHPGPSYFPEKFAANWRSNPGPQSGASIAVTFPRTPEAGPVVCVRPR
jgi:hypothetical protein